MDNFSFPAEFICGYYNSGESKLLSAKRIAKSFEIEYYLENGLETYINNKKYPISANHIIITKPGDIRYSRLPFKTAFLKFSAEGYIAKILSDCPEYFLAIHKKQITGILHEIIVLNEKEEKDILMLGGKFLSLLSIITNDGKCRPQGKTVNYRLMHSAKKYIESHFNEHISTTDIAKSINLSESRFRVLFTSAYGISPHGYLTEVRISASKEMLWNIDTPISEIAEKCGFGSQQYFTDTFKKCTGISPGKYRIQFANKYKNEV